MEILLNPQEATIPDLWIWARLRRGFLHDTNILSEFSRTLSPHPIVAKRLSAEPSEHLYISVLTTGEIRRGIEILPPGRRRTQLEDWQRSSFFRRTALANHPRDHGSVGRAVRPSPATRNTLPVIDGLLAATAPQHDLTVATRNTSDFAGLVPLFNPWEHSPST
jgi:toxin FitB